MWFMVWPSVETVSFFWLCLTGSDDDGCSLYGGRTPSVLPKKLVVKDRVSTFT